MDISIIIVNWNTGSLLYNCVKSIVEETKGLKYEIIIVDNNSKDNSCDNIEKDFNNVNIIYSKDNLGFSKGNNLGIEHAKGKFLLLLNPDTIILDNAIYKSYMKIKEYNDEKVLMGVRLLNGDKSLQLSSCKFFTVSNSIFSSYVFSNEDHYSTHDTDWVMGAYMLIDRDFYERIGKLNEDYFMYSEDMELCYKVKGSGGRVVFYSDAEIIHLYNQSGKNKFNKKREKVVKQSSVKFIRDNYRGIQKYGVITILELRYLLKKLIKR